MQGGDERRDENFVGSELLDWEDTVEIVCLCGSMFVRTQVGRGLNERGKDGSSERARMSSLEMKGDDSWRRGLTWMGVRMVPVLRKAMACTRGGEAQWDGARRGDVDERGQGGGKRAHHVVPFPRFNLRLDRQALHDLQVRSEGLSIHQVV